ncbi:MAG: glycosyltransferase family 4 protein [Pseudomonadota bacterium]
MAYKIAVLHQGFVPTYRARFFEQLNQRSASRYVVFHGDPPKGSGWQAAPGPLRFPNVRVVNREIQVLRWRAIYQPVVRQILSDGYDAVVMGHELKFLSNLLLAARARQRGKPVIFWGFGYHAKVGVGFQANASDLMFGVVSRLKDMLARQADGYLAYTESGAVNLRRIGMPEHKIWVVRNTIDIEEQAALHEKYRGADLAALRAELGLRPDSVVLLYIGRLLPAKQVELLIETIHRINAQRLCRRPVELLIIGDGPAADALRARAVDMPSVRFLGAIYDQDRVARIMRVAAAMVIPGFVGLAVNHAFAQGLPVITRDHALHSPEIEYLQDGENGLIVPGDLDAFAGALADFADSPDLQARLAAGALGSREELRLDYMVSRFDEAVTATVRRARGVIGERRDRTAARAADEAP